jgi:putative toxin-antitoxin system antitoxin component (TIGR02293 family)
MKKPSARTGLRKTAATRGLTVGKVRKIVAPKSGPSERRKLPFEGFKRRPRGQMGRDVVLRCLLGNPGTGKSIAASELIRSLKAGLPVRELDDLRGSLDLPMEKLAPMLGISKATLHRRKTAGKLDVAESDRVVRFARLLGQAASVMESLENGRRWLTSPQVGLGGAIPLEYAETEVGAREVEHLLGRIEYGVYS